MVLFKYEYVTIQIRKSILVVSISRISDAITFIVNGVERKSLAQIIGINDYY